MPLPATVSRQGLKFNGIIRDRVTPLLQPQDLSTHVVSGRGAIRDAMHLLHEMAQRLGVQHSQAAVPHFFSLPVSCVTIYATLVASVGKELGWRLKMSWHWVRKLLQSPGDPSYLSSGGRRGSWVQEEMRSKDPGWAVPLGPQWKDLPSGVSSSARTAWRPAAAAQASTEAGLGLLVPLWSEANVSSKRGNQRQTRMDAESLFIQTESEARLSEARLSEMRSTKSKGKRVVNRYRYQNPRIRITDQTDKG